MIRQSTGLIIAPEYVSCAYLFANLYALGRAGGEAWL
uniref:Uncharacterized protein n=1 Tax=Anguilla anguilla TaxID=7936 RepID=A0A0E9TJ54_ANGAN